MTKQELMDAKITNLQRAAQKTGILSMRDLKKDDVVHIETDSGNTYWFRILDFLDEGIRGILSSTNPKYKGPMTITFDGSSVGKDNGELEHLRECVKLGARCFFKDIRINKAKLVKVNGVQILPAPSVH